MIDLVALLAAALTLGRLDTIGLVNLRFLGRADVARILC